MREVDRYRRRFAGETRQREFYFVGVAVLLLAAGLVAVWFAQSILKVKGDAVLVALLVVPVFVYLALSGRVREFTAGGLSVRLDEVSREPASDVATVDADSMSDLGQPIKKTDPNRPQVATLTQGRKYDRDEVLKRLYGLAAIYPIPFLVVLDRGERVLAYMTYRSALDLLERPERSDEFMRRVEDAGADEFDASGFSGIRTQTLPHTATNAQALATMEEADLNALVVVDRKGRFEGLIERERLLSRMVLALVSSPTKPGS